MRYRRQLTPSTLPPADAVRITLFGLDCAFTRVFLKTLLDSGVAISAIFLPGPPSTPQPIRANLQRRSITLGTPGNQPSGIRSIADVHEIPVWRAGSLRSERTMETLAGIQAELLVCACFNRKLPAKLYESFPLGGVNVHPSLLPDKRGPDPLFWTLKEGTGQTGVTIHRLSPRFDAGPILAQAELSYSDGVTETDLDRLAADRGARLLVDLLPDMKSGTAPEFEQDHARATDAPFPSTHDFQLDPNRPARSAYNFVHGISGRGVPITVDWEGQTYRVLDALAYDDEPLPLAEGDPAIQWMPFTPGSALLRLASPDIRETRQRT